MTPCRLSVPFGRCFPSALIVLSSPGTKAKRAATKGGHTSRSFVAARLPFYWRAMSSGCGKCRPPARGESRDVYTPESVLAPALLDRRPARPARPYLFDVISDRRGFPPACTVGCRFAQREWPSSPEPAQLTVATGTPT